MRGFPVPDGPLLDLDIRGGEVIQITGPNGSGKTSLLRALAGLDGAVRPASSSTSRTGFAMQNAMDTLIGLTVHGEFRLRDQSPPHDLDAWADRDVATLSAGEARRVAIAVARRAGPLVLLDEPSEGLDTEAWTRLESMLSAVRAAGGAIIIADHGERWHEASDRTIALGAERTPQLEPIPSPDSPVLLDVPAATKRVGDRTLRFPPLRLTAGFHVLTGANGSGKTQTLRHAWQQSKKLRMLPAQARDLLGHSTVAAELADVEPWVLDALVSPHCMDRHPWTLSGGEQQRVALSKALGRPSPVFLLDEPEAHLDNDGRAALHSVVSQRVAEGSCILAATHDPALIAAASSVVSMEASE